MLKTRNKFIEDKVVDLKTNIKALTNNFKTTLQSFKKDIEVLKKAILQGTLSSSKDPFKIYVLEPKGFNDN